ncbi:MAG: hypothetical protein WC156_17040 [Pedobacter sp.]
MNLRIVMSSILLLSLLLASMSSAYAETAASIFEQSISDTLDLWREGRYEQLYERLSHRGKTSREQFVARMRDSTRRPACCWQKMENFRVLNEKRTEATVYVKIGLEGTPSPVESSTRDFKLSNESQIWKMQLNDIFDLSGASGKKSKHGYHKKKY